MVLAYDFSEAPGAGMCRLKLILTELGNEIAFQRG